MLLNLVTLNLVRKKGYELVFTVLAFLNCGCLVVFQAVNILQTESYATANKCSLLTKLFVDKFRWELLRD